MKTYKIKVNGKVYEVEVETVTESDGHVTQTKEIVNQQQISVSGAEIKAPMAGAIINVKVNVGDHVKKGDVLVVLEAMKLENDVVAPNDGIVKAVLVSKGQAVASGQKIVVLG